MKIIERFPFTPKDRQALRIQTITAVEMEEKNASRRNNATAKAKASYTGLRPGSL